MLVLDVVGRRGRFSSERFFLFFWFHLFAFIYFKHCTYDIYSC